MKQLGETEDTQSPICIGVLCASLSQLHQIQSFVAQFSRQEACVVAISEIGTDPFELYFVVADATDEQDLAQNTSGNAVGIATLVAQAALTPCIVLGVQDDAELVDRAVAAGAADFLALSHLDVSQLEKAVHFALGRRRMQIALSAREIYLSSAQERDRQQLANILHDGPLQDLIGARFLLGASVSDSFAEDLQGSLQQVIQSIRSLCSELKPPALVPFGLEKAIRAHMQTFQARHPDFSVTLELDIDRQPSTEQQLFPEWVRWALFRVFQAAISNVIQHAQASHIFVRMRIDDAQLRLTIADDGLGFELPTSWLEFARVEQYGLLMMQERVDTLRGRMVVQSTPGSGTRVLVHVPISPLHHALPAYLDLVLPTLIAPAPVVPDRNG